MIVVDASVAVKWLFNEADADRADALLTGEARLHAPGLIGIEVAAAILRKFRVGEIGIDEADAAWDLWRHHLAQQLLSLEDDRIYLRPAFDIGLAIRHPFQDCLYVALAAALGAPLVTADAKLVTRARQRYPTVHVLGSFP